MATKFSRWLESPANSAEIVAAGLLFGSVLYFAFQGLMYTLAH